MKLGLRKLIPIILVGVSLVVLGAVLLFSPVCNSLIELKSGNMTHMKCFYTGKAAIILSILLLVSGITSYFKNGFQWVIIAIGILLIIITFESAIGIGLCKMDTMPCHNTAAWIRGGGIISIILGILMFYKKK